jgi:hypothetical protein
MGERTAIGLFCLLSITAACAVEEEPGEELGLRAGEEEDPGDEGPVENVVGGTQSAVGCAAVRVSQEAHSGGILGYYTSSPRLWVYQVKFRIYNPSSTNCSTMQLKIDLVDDIPYTTTFTTSLTTSLSAHKVRWIYWTLDWTSANSNWWQDVFVYRNGTSILTTFLPGYFLETGQY